MFEQINLLGDTQQESNDWKWTMANDYPKEKNGIKVFSCFAGGGGSTMGYKLAGCDVIGCNEIDPRMNSVYVANHHPKYNYLEDIRDFNKREDLPEELYNLDILDGSPPCTTFSMIGLREKSWGQEKKFREGQKLQTLDDLLFVFIDTVAKLKPKVAIMENVEGLTKGNAWKYVQEIYSRFHKIGYKVKHWLLKGENMGVPQLRHRVFFVATMLNVDIENVNMNFNYKPVPYGQIQEGQGRGIVRGTKTQILLDECREDEHNLRRACERLYGKKSWFNAVVLDRMRVMPTIRAKMPDILRRKEKTRASWQDVRNSQTFPQDFDFISNSDTQISYICGMSVPPIMIKRLVNRLIENGLFDYKLKREKGDNNGTTKNSKCGDKF